VGRIVGYILFDEKGGGDFAFGCCMDKSGRRAAPKRRASTSPGAVMMKWMKWPETAGRTPTRRLSPGHHRVPSRRWTVLHRPQMGFLNSLLVDRIYIWCRVWRRRWFYQDRQTCFWGALRSLQVRSRRSRSA